MTISVSESTRLWEKVLKKIEEKINEKKTYDTFFANSYIYSIEGNVINISAPSSVAKVVLETQYFNLINSIISDLTEDDYSLKFLNEEEIAGKKKASSKVKNEVKEVEKSYFKDSRLNPLLTFDNFVVGEFNKKAQKAALYVAKNGGTLYNPLFIYSRSGLGKTHLLQAIGNEILKSRMPNANILYITADDFINEYVCFVRAERGEQSLRDFFKGVDVLLIDDIQFLSEKVKTEEAFFYVYQDMINHGKSVVLTCDKQPKDLKGLEDRLVTRFSQGLTIKIEDPDKYTCEQIVKQKLIDQGLSPSCIDDDVINFLAEKFSDNVRNLEGALNAITFYAFNIQEIDRITIDVAIEAINSTRDGYDAANQLSEKKIISIVADYYKISPSEITSKVRTGQIALARHISMYLIRKHLDVSLKKIGETFGGKDHTTVMSGISKVEKELKTDEQLKSAITELEKRILQ